MGATRVEGIKGQGIALGKADTYVDIPVKLEQKATVEFQFKPNWDGNEIYELLPGKVRTDNAHSSRETAHVVAKDHKIVNEPHDITDDAYYTAWAWTAGDTYSEWEEYIVITTETEKENSEPSWLVHESMPVVVTTI